MSAIELARAERTGLCDLLETVGPDQATLCQGWTTRDLAAHLVVRESRPDASLGVLGGPLAAWTDKVQSDARSQPFDKLVSLIRSGPPIWSAYRLPWVDGQLNTIEFYVHHEDVRRGGPAWTVRDLDGELQDFIWDRLKLAGRGWFAKAHTGVTLVRTDGAGARHTVKSGDDMITLTGTAAELQLIAFGRSEAEVAITGARGDVALFRERVLPHDEGDEVTAD